MNVISFLYTELFWRPLFNGLVLLYEVLPGTDLGVAIIVLTFIIRALLAPLLWKGQKAQKELARLQPEIKRIQKEFKNNREGQGKAMMELYQQNGVNPFSGCVLLLIQLPILIALLGVFRSGFDPASLSYLYSFVHNPGPLDHIAFGFLDLSKGNIYLGVVAAITQYFQGSMTVTQPPAGEGNDIAQMMALQMKYFLPVIVLVSSFTLPAALSLYWTALNTFGILQEVIMRMITRQEPKGS